MRLFRFLRRAPLLAALFVLLLAAPAQSQPPLPVPEMPTAAPRAQVKHTVFAAPKDIGAGDRFASDVAISDDGLNAVVGIPGDTSLAPTQYGAVEIYKSQWWSDYYYLWTRIAPSENSESGFGRSVDVVGSGQDMRIAISSDQNTYVYRLNGLMWVKEAVFAVGGGGLALSGSLEDMTLATTDSSDSKVYIFRRLNGVWQQEFVVTPNSSEITARFGVALAVAGTAQQATLVVGAPAFNDPISGGGRVFIYQRGASGWELRDFIADTTPIVNGGFGSAVAIDGDGGEYIIAVGAPNDATQWPTSSTVSIFDLTSNSLTFDREFIGANTLPKDHFGFSVAVKGTSQDALIAVGSPHSGDLNEGRAELFRRTSGTWSNVSSYLTGVSEYFETGYAVDLGNSLTDPQLLVGSPGYPGDMGNAPDMGAAFVASPAINSEHVRGLPYGEFYNYERGGSLALAETLNGKTMAVSAPYAPSPNGAIEIYDMLNGEWQLTGTLIDPEFPTTWLNHRIWHAISMIEFSGNLIIAAEVTSDLYAFPEQVLIFSRPADDPTAAWEFTNRLSLSNTSVLEYDGMEEHLTMTVAGGSLWLAVGAPDHRTTRGVVYLFKYDGSTWLPPTLLAGSTVNTRFGLSVSLTQKDDLPLLAVGDALNQILIYAYNGVDWSQQATILPEPDLAIGSFAKFDAFGYALEFLTATDSVWLAIGTPAAKHGEDIVGAVQIYKYDGTTWNRTARIQPDGLRPFGSFGASLALSQGDGGILLAAGAANLYSPDPYHWPWTNPLTFLGSGMVYQFALIGSEWVPFGIFDVNAEWWSLFGSALDLLGGRHNFTLVIGEPSYEPVTENWGLGAVHIYEHLSLSFTGADDLAVTEGGAEASYTVALPLKPTANVDIVITTSGECTLNGLDAGAALVQTFTPATWNIPQTVTIAAVDDSITEGAHTCTLSHEVSSADAGYGSLAVAPIVVQIADNDAVQPSELLANGGFELALSSAWTVKNATGDKRVCSAKGDGSPCAFKFTGGISEKSSLNQTIVLSGTRAAASIFTLSGRLSAGAGKSLKVKVKTVYNDGSADVYATTWKSTGAGYQTYQSVFAQVTDGAARIVLTIVNKNTSGKLWLDDLSLTALTTRSAAPLPEQAPDTFRGQN